MEPNRDARVDQLFEHALELPEPERSAWLAAECAGDEALRREVEELLALSAREVDDLMAPVRELAADAIEENEGGLEPGERIGAYTVVDRLGRGGMGVVHLAERADGSFEKRVAIKVLPSAASSREAVLRFEQERRILGRLSHPHIAQLVDGGVDPRGLPYLVLEYVEGEPVDAWCDRRRASIDERLRLVVEIATALQTAHRNLVVHRDIKPSNLLVTADGDVKVLDFGIAKLLDPDGDDDALTRTDGRPMTPTWASPEQVTGTPITVASDVYQLGLLLYELTTGLRPQASRTSSLAELVDLVCRHEPLPPSRAVLVDGDRASAGHRAALRGATPARLARRFRPDLDAIVAQALAKDPERRYTSVAELAADLERFRAGRPVHARRAGFADRAGKWLRRNAALSAAAAVAALLTVGYAVAVTIQSRALDRQRQRAEVEAVKAAEVERFVLGLFESSDPGVALGREVTARELLERGVARADTELAGQPEVQARLWSALGEIHGQLDLFREGRELLERALEQQRRLHGEHHLEVAETYERLGTLLSRLGEIPAALDALSRALRIWRSLSPPDSPQIARVLTQLGHVTYRKGDFDASEELHREALGIWRRRGSRGGIASSLSSLGIVSSARGDYVGAEQLYRRALETGRAVWGDRSPQAASYLGHLGDVLRRQDKFEAALEALELSLEIQREIYGSEHLVLTNDELNLAMAWQQTGELERADAVFAELLPRLLSKVEPHDIRLSGVRLGLGRLRVLQARPLEAEELLRQALADYTLRLGPGNFNLGKVQLWLGRCLMLQGRREEALAAWRAGWPTLRERGDEGFVAAYEKEFAAAGETPPAAASTSAPEAEEP